MKRLVLKSPAKINLYLRVLNKRPDGCHNLETLFERIGLYDKIILEEIPQDSIEVRTFSPDIPKDKNNLAYKAAFLLKRGFSIKRGIRITIDKHIPVGSGLGGGSSNAAFVLLGLNRLWRLELSKKKLMEYAGKIGADVAFFILEKPFALGKGRGERLLPLAVKIKLWHILVVPGINVPTAQVYKDFDRLSQHLQLTKGRINSKIIPLILKPGHLMGLAQLVYNDLERVTAQKHKIISVVLTELKKTCLAAGMSGSGSAVFGITTSKNSALRIIKNSLSKFKGLRVFTARTC